MSGSKSPSRTGYEAAIEDRVRVYDQLLDCLLEDTDGKFDEAKEAARNAGSRWLERELNNLIKDAQDWERRAHEDGVIEPSSRKESPLCHDNDKVVQEKPRWWNLRLRLRKGRQAHC